MALTIYGLRDSCRSQVSMVTAELAGVPVTCPSFTQEDARSAEFLAKSPLGRTPLLETSQGNIIGSRACATYIAHLAPGAELMGRNFHEQRQVDMWIEVTENELEVPLSAWVYPSIGLTEKNEEGVAMAKADVAKALSYVNDHLMNSTFLVGERLTLADVFLATPLVEAYRTVFDADMPKKYPALFRWFFTCVNQPAFIRAFGSVKASGGVTGTPMNLDEWKRYYSNCGDLRGDAMKWFWEHYDPEANSLYHMSYDKVDGECEVGFVTSNQLGGFLQRFDPEVRKKWGFAATDVVGKDGCFDIVGVWLFAGTTDIPQCFKDHPSVEYNKFRKLDSKKEEDRKLVEDYWCNVNEGELVEGRPVFDCKIFK